MLRMLKRKISKNMGLVLSSLLVVTLLLSSVITSYASLDTVNIVPTRVFEKYDSEGGTTYMMDAKSPDGEYLEYKLTGNIAFLHFSSGQLKNQLNDSIGKEVVCKTTGWRVYFLSMYENIHECEF